MTGKILKVGVALVIAAVAVSTVARGASNTSDRLAKEKLRRKVQLYQQSERFKRETNKSMWLRDRADGSRGTPATSFGTSIVRDHPVSRESFASSSGAVPPPPSPGVDMGFTAYDFQSNGSQGYNVARTPSANKIHFTWMVFDHIPETQEEANRVVVYMAFTDPGNYPTMTPTSTPYGGKAETQETVRGGYCGIDVDATNHAQIALHKVENDYATDPYKPWHIQYPFASELNQTFPLTGYDASCPGTGGGIGGVLWPRITGDRGSAILHEIAHSNVNDCPQDKLWYWRFDGTAWTLNPKVISTTPDIAYVLGADEGSDKVAVAIMDLPVGASYYNVGYYESATNGTDWLALPVGTLPTLNTVQNYAGTDLTAYNHLSITYDNDGYVHIAWDEQEIGAHTRLKHWSNNPASGGVRTITQGYWDNPGSTGLQSLNLTKPTLGIGDGSTLCSGQPNDNYVYLTFCQFGGLTATSLNDYSSEYSYEGRTGGYMNGEVYLAVSNSAGNTWSPTVNLTNTKTPGCQPGLANPATGDPLYPDSVCRSEMWATIGRVVKDIDVFMISDMDAGGIPYGEGSWQLNPVHYLQLSGTALTTAGGVCPVIAPVFAASMGATADCEYNAPRAGAQATTLTISNFGNATLNQGGGGGVSVTQFAPAGPTITGVTTGAYSIAPGGADIVNNVSFNSNNAAEGLYTGSISITHNDTDPGNPSPRVFPIEFFVFDVFFCPEDEVLKTGVASPGVLNLAVESNGRFAQQAGTIGNLWRYNDSSLAMVDGSLLLAKGTDVFNQYAPDQNNWGGNGLRAQSDLCIDTTGYGAGSKPYAMAGAYMTTTDSIMGVNMSWYFPQNTTTGQNEFVIVNYRIFPGPDWVANGKPAINNIASGLIADIELYPGQGLTRLGLDTMQSGNHNHGLIDGTRPNLVYVRGTKEAWRTVVDPDGAGPSAPKDPERFRAGIAVASGMEGAVIGNFGTDLTNGASDAFLYNRLQNVAGAEILTEAQSDTDLYVLAGFDRGINYVATSGAGSFFHPSTVGDHFVIFASDTIDDASFKATIDLATNLVNAGGVPFSKCAVCPCAYDPGCDGVTTVVDVGHVVNGAFRNTLIDPSLAANPNQTCCHFDSRDVNADGVISVLDVTMTVDVAFRNKQYLTSTTPSFVDPCTKW